LTQCFDLVRERLGPELHSLWFNANCEGSNTILGADFQHDCGPESVVEHFGGAAVHYRRVHSGRNNLGIAQHIIEHVRARIPQGGTSRRILRPVSAPSGCRCWRRQAGFE